jgi:hypothetical protein
MFIASFLRIRVVAAVALAQILATTANGFAASNTVATSNAGDGSGQISGYHVNTPTYVLNSTDPTMLDTVNFDISPDNSGSQPDTVKVQLVSSGTWYSATYGGSGTAWSVDLTPGGSGGVPSGAGNAITVASVTTLHVVAADT